MRFLQQVDTRINPGDPVAISSVDGVGTTIFDEEISHFPFLTMKTNGYAHSAVARSATPVPMIRSPFPLPCFRSGGPNGCRATRIVAACSAFELNDVL